MSAVSKTIKLPSLQGKLIVTHYVGPRDGKYNVRLNDSLTQFIAELVAQGASFSQISLLPEMPSAIQLQRWLKEDPEFREKVELARKARAEKYADIAVAVAEKTTAKNSKQNRVKIDTLKWRAGCDDPDRYGQRTKITGDPDKPLTFLLDTGFQGQGGEPKALTIYDGDPAQRGKDSDAD